MTTFIILSQADADHVLTDSLRPIQRQPTAATPDPVFILNTLVLADPEHAQHHAYLAALPQMDDSAPLFPPVWPSESEARDGPA